MNEDFVHDFIKVSELKEMLSNLSDNDLITVTKGSTAMNHKITHIEDSTVCGFWELRIQ